MSDTTQQISDEDFFDEMTADDLGKMRVRIATLESAVQLALRENEATRCGLREDVCRALIESLASPSEPSPAPQAERVIEVAPQEEIPLPGVEMISRVTMMPIDMVQTVLEDGSCSSGMDVERYAHAAYHFAAELITTESALTTMREERDIRHTAIQQPFMDKIQEMSKGLTGLRGERDQLKSHYSDAKELIQRMMKEEEVLREERDQAQDVLRAILPDYCDYVCGEGPHRPSCTEGHAVLDAPVSDRQPEGKTK